MQRPSEIPLLLHLAAHGWLGLASAVVQAPLDRPEPSDRETVWSAWIAQEMGGEAEHRCPDGSRIDVLTADRAWEVEWPEKWAESVGQAVLYRAWANRDGGVVLLTGRRPLKAELPYLLRARVACSETDLTLMCVDVDRDEPLELPPLSVPGCGSGIDGPYRLESP